MDINWWTAKQNVIYLYNDILLSNKNEPPTDRSSNIMILSNIILSEKSQN